jgi:Cu-Zn family superoxide dismutase
MRRALVLACALLLVGKSAMAAEPTWSSAEAEIRDARGEIVGRAVFTPKPQGVAVSVEVSRLSPGTHGIHVHAVGKCDPPDFKTAGGHFNPGGKKHGLKSAEGAHAGDLPNLEVGPKRTGKLSAMLPDATLKYGDPASLLGPEGSSIVIHAKADDEKTDPSGDSGDRIACGVIIGKR